MKIYTKTGDGGETALFSGERVAKDNLLVDAYGTVDELNSAIGMAFALHTADGKLAEVLRGLQTDLLNLGADLASGEPHATRITDTHVGQLETLIDELTEMLPVLTSFILPNGHPVAAQLHVARTICRRAERCAVTVNRERGLDAAILRYLNRMADALFVIARYANHVYGVVDEVWAS